MKKTLLRQMYEFLGTQKVPYIIMNISCLLYNSIFVLIYSYLFKLFFNSVEYGGFSKFIHACILCGIICVIDYFSVYLWYYKMKLVRVIVFRVKTTMFHQLVRMDMVFFEKHHSGDTLKRLNGDANSLKEFYYGAVHRVIEPVCMGLASIVMMTYYNWLLAICSVLFSIITVKLSLSINQIIRKQNKEIQKKMSRLSERLSDILSGFLILKLYAGSSIVIKNFNEENEQVAKGTVKRSKVLSRMEMLSFLIGTIASFGTIAVGIILVTKGMIDYGTIMAIVTLQLSLSGGMQEFGGAVANLTGHLVRAERVVEFLQMETEVGRDKTTKEYMKKLNLEENTDGIRMNHVSFSYKKVQNEKCGVNNDNLVTDHSTYALSDMSIHIQFKERVMLVGSSGCGKSTLLKLLMGFYEKDAGDIYIFGKRIEDYSKQELRRLITYVPQASFLFEGTIDENIRYGNPSATKEEVVHAAKMAYADDFISNLPNRYETKVVLGGGNLSGGQRQRIAIARAFLKDTPIVLLDEPSSALDVESESMINRSMKELMKDKLVIMVTHRTNSFREFDRVIRL